MNLLTCVTATEWWVASPLEHYVIAVALNSAIIRMNPAKNLRQNPGKTGGVLEYPWGQRRHPPTQSPSLTLPFSLLSLGGLTIWGVRVGCREV